MINKTTVCLIVFGSLFCLSGCWDHRELDDLAIVMAMGADKGTGNRYLFSFQIVNPGEMIKDSPKRATTTTTYVAEGRTPHDAALKIGEKLSREIYFSHLRVYVIGEELAREGIENLFDTVERSQQGRMNYSVLVARQAKARDMISSLSPMEKISGAELAKTIKTAENSIAQTFDTTVNEIVNAMWETGREPAIPGAQLLGDPKRSRDQDNLNSTEPDARLSVSGIAMFKGGRLVRWLDGPAARGAVFARNRAKNATIAIPCGKPKDWLTIDIIGSQTKTTVKIKQNKPVILIDVLSEGKIGDVNCRIDISDPSHVERLQQKTSQIIAQEIREAVTTAQKAKSDIFGFGEVLHQQNPEAWRVLRKNWPRHFAGAEVKIQALTFIRSTGMRYNSFQEHQILQQEEKR